MFVLDEIQTGLGRCGHVWRSAGRHCTPDIVLAGKTLGGGLIPVSAAAFAGATIGESTNDPVLQASSFAGGSLAGAVGRAVVGLTAAPGFLATVRSLGDAARGLLASGLGGRADVVEVRGEGLMLGIECASPAVAGQVVLEAARRGVLVTFCLHRPSVLRVYPPACCTGAELRAGVEAIVDSFRAVEAADAVSQVI